MGGGTQVSTSESAPWKGQQKYLLKGFDKAESMFNKIPEYYPDETLAGFDPTQIMAQNAIQGYITGPRALGMQQNAENVLASMGGASSQAMGYGAGLARNLSPGQYGGLTPFNQGQYANLMAGNVPRGPGTPYGEMESALTQGVMGNLKENILPGIRQQQVGYQPGGSSRGNLVQNQAIAKAVKSGLTQPLAQMYSDAYQTAQGMRLPAAQMGIGQQQYGMGYGLQGGQLGQAALSQYPGVMQAPLGMYGALGGVGASRRAMTQAGIDRNMARYQYEATAPQQALANYMNMVQGNYGGQTTQTTPGPTGMQNMSSAIGMIGTLAALSDARLKENIEQIGTHKGLGIGIYKYNFPWSPKTEVGVMAQEVEKVKPEAVIEVGGVKAVDYGKL